MMDFSELSDFKSSIERAEQEMEQVFRSSARHVGKKFKEEVVPLTPIYTPDPPYHASDSGKPRTGGNLRNSWKVKRPQKSGNTYSVTIENSAKSSNGHIYASDVEYGHKQHKGKIFPVFVNGKLEYRYHQKGYVKGLHFMAIARERSLKGRYAGEYTRRKVEECLQRI